MRRGEPACEPCTAAGLPQAASSVQLGRAIAAAAAQRHRTCVRQGRERGGGEAGVECCAAHHGLNRMGELPIDGEAEASAGSNGGRTVQGLFRPGKVLGRSREARPGSLGP